ncbi:flagellar transcriptional regulator FlhD [Ralstonia pickettii DTP0602]|nr:flagellar transcriptional regulator FlhD [Ralstonia pickettii DTP0602]
MTAPVSQSGAMGIAMEPGPGASGIVSEIKALNLSYLMLVQRLMRENEAEALFRLGLGREMGCALAALTPAQMVALARSNLVLCRFRLDDSRLLAGLTGTGSPHALQNMHAAIVTTSQDSGDHA